MGYLQLLKLTNKKTTKVINSLDILDLLKKVRQKWIFVFCVLTSDLQSDEHCNHQNVTEKRFKNSHFWTYKPL